MTVHLHIERVVLHDLPIESSSRTQLQRAVQQELSLALLPLGLDGWSGPDLAVPDLPPVAVTSTPQGLPAGIAGGVAGALAGLGGRS